MITKKGMELSIQFFVLLILALVIFGYSVSFIYELFDQASKLESMAFDQLDKQVELITCGTQQVCLGTARKTITRGSFKIFTVRVLNSRNERADFSMVVEDSGIGPGGAGLLYFKPESRDFTLSAGEIKSLGIGVEVPATAVSGNYVLNVKVTSDNLQYGGLPAYKINVIVP